MPLVRLHVSTTRKNECLFELWPLFFVQLASETLQKSLKPRYRIRITKCIPWMQLYIEKDERPTTSQRKWERDNDGSEVSPDPLQNQPTSLLFVFMSNSKVLWFFLLLRKLNLTILFFFHTPISTFLLIFIHT